MSVRSETEERKRLYLRAIDEIVTHGKSFKIGDATYTSADIPDLRALVADCDRILSGGGQRRFSTLRIQF